MDINERYLKVRAAVRDLGCRESLYVIWAYCQFLQLNAFRFPDDIKVSEQFLEAAFPNALIAEFNLEQISREVIRHSNIVPRRGRTLRNWDTMAYIINNLRALDGEIYQNYRVEDLIHIELMRIAHQQFAWQHNKPNWQSIIRYYKIYNSDAINSHSERATGLTIDQIYIIGMSYMSIFFENPRSSRILNVKMPGFTQEHFDRFLDFTSLRRNTLAKRLREEHSLDEQFAYRYSSLREFPLVQISHCGRDELACPIPTLLFWRITSGLYYTMKDVPGFFNDFGNSFQSYAGDVLSKKILDKEKSIIPEEFYYAGKDKKATVDWIVRHRDEAALFVECKAKRLTWASKSALVTLDKLQQDLDKLASAVVQVYKSISDYKNGSYPSLPFLRERHVYPVVLTIEDWYCFGREMPTRLDALVRGKMRELNLQELWLEQMPYSILSMEEMENVAIYIDEIGIHTLFTEKNRNKKYEYWSFGKFCVDKYGTRRLDDPPLFKHDMEELFQKIAK